MSLNMRLQIATEVAAAVAYLRSATSIPNRPTMKEVAVELETVRTSHIPSAVQNNTKAVTYGHELTMLSYGESTSTFLNSDENITQ
nr:wall-associated receptor kinase-like 2 [Tanacetum cinerariifolium]